MKNEFGCDVPDGWPAEKDYTDVLGPTEVVLDGVYAPEQLEQLAAYMRALPTEGR